MQVEPDYYGILGLKPGSSLEEVKNHYRRLAKIFHPDLNNNDAWCQEQIKELNLAYEYLLDPARKASYDARLRFASGLAEAFAANSASSDRMPFAGDQACPNAPPAPPRMRPSPAEESPSPHPIPPRLRPLRLVFGGGRSFVVSPQAILGFASVPFLVGLVLWLAPETAYVGSGGERVGLASRLPAGISSEALPAKQTARPSPPSAFPEDPDPFARQVSVSPAPVTPASADDPGQEARQAAGLAAPLLTRCSAALPRADVLITLGDRAYGANENALYAPEEAGAGRRASVARLERELSVTKTQRTLIYADEERLQWVQSREEMQRLAPSVANDLRGLAIALKSVQTDLQAVSEAANPSPVTAERFHALAPPVAPAIRSEPKAPFNPHLASPSADEPQFSMPTGASSP